MKGIWINWERHRRAREIARALKIPIVEVIPPFSGVIRYIPMLLRTTLCLLRERPTHLFVQCPSVVLGLWAVLLKPLLRYVIIADLHNEAVEPFINKSRLYDWILRQLHRHAALSIVSNAGLTAIVQRNGGRPFVLPDRVPNLGSVVDQDLATPFRVVFVCTFAPDEPYREVFAAARNLDGLVTVYVTGRTPAEPLSPGVPANVTLTGYLADNAYEDLLREAHVVVDLTAMNNCLVCGAYEAVALEKPLVTSDTLALRSHFRRGTVFTRHDEQSIADAIRSALKRRAELAQEMHLLRRELEAEWAIKAADLLNQVVGSREACVADEVSASGDLRNGTSPGL
jgi:glycosyltransferase involved in cell wall biosynthesis